MSMTIKNPDDLSEADHRSALLNGLLAYQRVLAEHCEDSTTAESIAIRAHHEAIRNVKDIGRQPLRAG
jgi:hypothetical protein